MNDILGREINPGDYVAYASNTDQRLLKVISVEGRTIKGRYLQRGGRWSTMTVCDHGFIIINKELPENHLLRKL